ncbi:unnamed protein product [Brachionus calyciflorus]|uniref:BED-type domain-containing protein n=1 Tax=Brachionus calyciflorus TaxID=104777 RepID=A0A814N7R4_9BILA|nr:unnamed protein product [Brachionus calyciflorus]
MPPRRTRNSNRNINAQSNSPPLNLSNSSHSENNEDSSQASSQTTQSSSQATQLSSQTTENNEFIITEEDQVRLDRLINDALNDVFHKKIIRINGKNNKYSAILNFFDFVTEFETKPKRSIPFKCFQCGKVYKAKLGESGNLKKHLEKRHKNLKNWLKSYLKHINRNSRKWNLDNNLTDLAKYFLTYSTAMKELDNPFLRKMLNFEIPSQQTFKSNILPEILQNLNTSFEEMLNEAKSICLITDLWSNKSNEQYLALAVSMVNNDHSKKLRIIGMTPTNGSSNAESIKQCIERIINAFNFDKRKIIGICCDQGSSLLRLFSQNQNNLFDDHIFIQNDNLNGNNSVRNENRELELNYAFSQIDREIQEVADDEVIFIEEVHIDESDEELEEDDLESNQSSLTDQSINTQVNPNSNNLNEAESDQINFLNIQIGTNSIPRYSCAAHKINLAVRSSIKLCRFFSKMLSQLSNYAATIRRSNINSLVFIEKKCKLRCENGTRWSSSYLMLESFYNAYEKGAFNNNNNQCPFTKDKIISYLKILHPLYTFSILSQKTDWTIGDIIPSLCIMLNESLIVTNERGERKKLIEELNKAIHTRFDFEINSKIYLTAALLNISKLELWYIEEYGLEYRRRAIASFKETVAFFLNDIIESPEEAPRRSNQQRVRVYQNSDNRALKGLVKSRPYQTPQDTTRINKINQIRVECDSYLDFIEIEKNREKSTQAFWNEFSYKFPNLSIVSRKVFSIPASSAFIERFFSICGLACDKRSMNMNP